MDLFESCRVVNDQLARGNEGEARDGLIRLLDEMRRSHLKYTPLVNHLIRSVGLFPYMDLETSSWQERFVVDAFKADVGEKSPVTLHREQSRLLSALLEGESIAVSAPTSFGKSFVIDSFIAVKRPATVVIIVPTIALTDETRRRLQRKFGAQYKKITTANQSLAAKNILIFPQERAQSYVEKLERIDMLIVDEFYKASGAFDKDRSPALINAMIRLSKVARQRYFLAPNIDNLDSSPLTEGMRFLPLDFNTVFLEKNELYEAIGKNEEKKSLALLQILRDNKGKTLIYAGTHTNVSKVSALLLDELKPKRQLLLQQCSHWMSRHYEQNWILAKLVARGVGIHTGQLHRSLSQIQIRLFEEVEGLGRLISTSSIIEGVNTSAENVVLWSNRAGTARINDFTYKNIIGRGGRMFRHFVGKVFVLEVPPPEEENNLELPFPDKLLGSMERDYTDIEYTPEQVAKIDAYEREMQELIGAVNLGYLQMNAALQSSDTGLVLKIARELRNDPQKWLRLSVLNSSNPDHWEQSLYNLVKLQPGVWEAPHSKFVAFVKALASNWTQTIPELLDALDTHDIGLEDFFKLERSVTFRLSTLLGDVQTLYGLLYPDAELDLSAAISRFSHAFLPIVVFQLEEYGLPRMLSRRLQDAGVFDFENPHLDIYQAQDHFRALGFERVVRQVPSADEFDKYILKYFYDGIGSAMCVEAKPD